MTNDDREQEIPWGLIAAAGLSVAAFALLLSARRDLLARFTPQERLRLQFFRELYRRGILRH